MEDGFNKSSVQQLRVAHLDGVSGVETADGILKSTLAAGYRYVAMALADGPTCGVYFLYGDKLPDSSVNPVVSETFCAHPHGSETIGLTSDSMGLRDECPVTKDPDHPPGVVTWKIYDLGDDVWSFPPPILPPSPPPSSPPLPPPDITADQFELNATVTLVPGN